MKKINYYFAGLSGLIILLPCHVVAQPAASALRESIIKNERATVHNNSEVVNTAASPAKTTNTPVFIDQANVLYRVQILALKHPINAESLRVDGMNGKVYAVKSPDITRYYIGEFHNLKAATQYKQQIIRDGFEDACVVAYKNGDRISIRQSLALVGGR